jgi:TonB family protein
VSGNIEGTVRIKLFVTTKGDVFKTIVQKSSGSALLDSAAVNYASKLKFIPAQINGEYRNIWLYKDFKYYIEKKLF